MEEDVVLSLIQLAWPEHELRAAFMHGSIQGHVYLEAKMDCKIGDLLQLISGVIRSRGATIKTCMEPSDWKAILSVPDAIVTHSFAVGKWALVSRGVYKSNLGYVSRIESWGGVTLLLVPCLRPPPSPKRKRLCMPSIPDPALFQPGSIQKIYGITLSKQAHKMYHFNGFVFEHRLILKPFDLHSVSSAFVLMSPILAALFAESGHPSILLSALITHPPLEMMFSQDEKVAVLSSWE